MTPLIPRKTLFANPDRAGLQISPDGSRIAFLAPRDGVLNLWVAPRDAFAQAQPVTHDTGRGIRLYRWAHTNRDLLYLQDRNGDENWRLYRVDVDTGETHDLTPLDGVQVQIRHLSHRHPDSVAVGLNDRDPRWHDLYRLDIATGARTLIERNDRFVGFVLDDDYRPVVAQEMADDGGATLFRRDADSGAWSAWETIPAEDNLTTGPIGLDHTGRILYFRESRGRNTAAVTAHDLVTGATTLLAEDPKSDAQDALVHPETHVLQGVAFTYARKAWTLLDPTLDADLAALRPVADGDIEIVSRSRDDVFWIVCYVLADGPARYHLYDRSRRTPRFLCTSHTALEDLPLVPMHPVVIPARDGLEMVAYVSLPKDSDPDGDGVPEHPLPTVLIPHGGPWARDTWRYNPLHQWLANRGYAVLCVNFRASTGFGKAHANAGDLQWAEKILDDQIDTVRWAIDRGIADPARVGIFGGSFGGYSVLAGLAFHPEFYACGVDLVGPSNLITLLESMPPYWKPIRMLFTRRVGDPDTPEGRALLEAHSPLTRVDHIVKPLLIGQGANDPRVKQAESDQIVDAMTARGIPVTYVLYPDEGHGFVRPENNRSFNAIAEAFLAGCLGGRVEPIGSDFDGASLQVRAGADAIEGLSEAVADTTTR